MISLCGSTCLKYIQLTTVVALFGGFGGLAYSLKIPRETGNKQHKKSFDIDVVDIIVGMAASLVGVMFYKELKSLDLNHPNLNDFFTITGISVLFGYMGHGLLSKMSKDMMEKIASKEGEKVLETVKEEQKSTDAEEQSFRIVSRLIQDDKLNQAAKLIVN